MGGDAVLPIGGDELSDTERDELQQLCRQRLDAFREQRGEEVACLFVEKPAASATAKRAVWSVRWSPSPSGCLGSLSASETQCLAVASERTAIRS
jgi:hypothetical protein